MIKKLFFGIPIALIVLWLTWTQLLDGLRGDEQDAISAESAADRAENTAAQPPPPPPDLTEYEAKLVEFEKLPMAERWETEEMAHRWMLRWAEERLPQCASVAGLTLTVTGPEYPEMGDWAAFSVSVEVVPMDRESARLLFSRLREESAGDQGMRLLSFEWGSSSSDFAPDDDENTDLEEPLESEEEDEEDEVNDLLPPDEGQIDPEVSPILEEEGPQDSHWDCVLQQEIPGLTTVNDEPACKLERVIDDPDRSLLETLRPSQFLDPPEELRAPPTTPEPVITTGLDLGQNDDEEEVEEDWSCAFISWTYEQVVRLPPEIEAETLESADAA